MTIRFCHLTSLLLRRRFSYSGLALRLARTVAMQFRLMYPALHFSVRDDLPEGHRDTPMFVDLSHLERVVVFLHIKVSPYFDEQHWQPTLRATEEQTGIWPQMRLVKMPDQIRYIRFTNYANSQRSI